MATQQQLTALAEVYAAAVRAQVPFPDAQACEVMVETTWLTSQLGVRYNNLFGMKQHAAPVYATVTLPTQEYIGGRWVTIEAEFVSYPSMAACFEDRTVTLVRLAPTYPHYAAALAATTPEDFLTQVSLSWSTGPTRGEECIEILHAHAASLR